MDSKSYLPILATAQLTARLAQWTKSFKSEAIDTDQSVEVMVADARADVTIDTDGWQICTNM